MDNELDTLSPKPPNRWKHALRRTVPRWVLFIGLGIIIYRSFVAHPAEVDVTYDYGSARRGLLAAEMRYMLGSEEIRRVRFNYANNGPGLTQFHRVQLTKGEYKVMVDLVYQQEIPGGMGQQKMAQPGGHRIVRLVRPLTVRRKGQMTIFIASGG